LDGTAFSVQRFYRHCGNDNPKWVQPPEEFMSSNLQDFSREQLSPDFLARFSTHLFIEEIEQWFRYASESVIPMYEQAFRFTTKESNKEFAKEMKKLCKYLKSVLDSSISKKQKLQKQGILNANLSELVLISDSSKIITNLAIFDWVHQYSIERFPREIDSEMIHLVFDFIGIPTFCFCKFENEDKSNLTFNQLERLMHRTTSFNGTVIIRELKSERFMKVLEFYQTDNGIKLWNEVIEI
jgi:hypothetical protein